MIKLLTERNAYNARLHKVFAALQKIMNDGEEKKHKADDMLKKVKKL